MNECSQKAQRCGLNSRVMNSLHDISNTLSMPIMQKTCSIFSPIPTPAPMILCMFPVLYVTAIVTS